MNTEAIKNAIGVLDSLLSDAKRALSQVEEEVFHLWRPRGSGGGFEEPRGAMGWYLGELHDVLLVVLEAAAMPDTRASLIAEWSKFTGLPHGLETTEDDQRFQNSSSPALTFLERLIDGLRASVVNQISSEEAWTLGRLETMLSDTAALVHRRGQPQNENELQKTMHDYLRAAFSGFRLNPSIGGTLKTFKPDCGIASVSAAIEFKIAKSKEEVAKAFSGIAEDTAGYKGSKDWTRFFAVVYQSKPFASKSDFHDDMKRIGAAGWTAILVNGPTKRKRLKKLLPKAKAKIKAKKAKRKKSKK